MDRKPIINSHGIGEKTSKQTAMEQLPEEPICTCREDQKSRPLCPVCDKEKYSEFMKDARRSRLKAPPEELEQQLWEKSIEYADNFVKENNWTGTPFLESAVRCTYRDLTRRNLKENQQLKAEIERYGKLEIEVLELMRLREQQIADLKAEIERLKGERQEWFKSGFNRGTQEA